MGPDPIVLRFHRTLYREGSLRAVAERFAHLARADFGQEGDYLTVTLTEVRPRARARIGDEWSNHALFQSIADDRAERGGLA